jgi:hypothetical protein
LFLLSSLSLKALLLLYHEKNLRRLDPEKTVKILKLLRIWLWEKAQHLFGAEVAHDESQEVRRDNESFFSIAIGIKLEAGAK